MLLRIAIVLIVVWLLGLVVFKIAAGLIHLLIIVAIVMAAMHFWKRRNG